MLRDVHLLTAKLGKVAGFGDTGDFLADLVNAKQVKGGTEAREDEGVVDKGADKGEAPGGDARMAEEQTNEEGGGGGEGEGS